MAVRPSIKDLAELIVSRRFGGHAPFKGFKPFVVVQSQTDTPRALVSDSLLQDRAEQYEVALTCTNQNEANRFVFQYTHELAHFYLTPLEHPFLEIIAVAISFCLLTDCANEWRRNNWGTYSSKFEDYKRTVVENAKQSLQLQSYFGLVVPIELVLQRDSEAAKSCDVDSSHMLAGVVLADAIMQNESTWTSLLSIHKHLIFSTEESHGTYGSYVNFGAWMREEALNNNEELEFRKQIVRMFGPIFGIESTSSHNQISRCLSVLSRCLRCQFVE